MQEQKEIIEKLKQRPSLSKHNRDRKEMHKLLQEKLARENDVPPLKFRKPAFVNNPKLKDKIMIGEPVFKREVRHDQTRAGYTQMLEKLKETQHLLVQIKNGKTLFESDMMRCNYTNPYLKHPETLERLKTYMDESKPKVDPCPVVNFIEEWREPLYS